MIEKARQFRSLLLEPLECRAVFSVDGLEVWHFSQHSLNFEWDRYQPAQYPHGEYPHGEFAAEQDFSLSDRNAGHSNDSPSFNFGEKRFTRGSSMHRSRFDNWNAPLPQAESEAPTPESAPKFDQKTEAIPTQPKPNQFVIFINTSPPLTQSHDFVPVSAPRVSVDASSPSRTNNVPTNFEGGNVPHERTPAPPSQNPVSKVSSEVKVDSTNATAAQANLSTSTLSAQSPSAPPPSGTTVFDFSTRLGIAGERPSAASIASQRVDEFQFTRPQAIPSPSETLFDQAMAERSASVESLENLLSGLAENHRRSRVHNGFETNTNSRNEQGWRPDANSAEVAFAEGGMIALALNRDVALSELEDISEDARSENIAWIANVGVFRALEYGAVAATENAGVTNRAGRTEESSSTTAELAEVEGEVADSRLHPLLASSSAALGAVIFGLRRIRKSTTLMFTSRKRKAD